MSYTDGVVAAVTTANKDAYLAHAEKCAVLFKKYGALKVVENWGDDVPEGEVNSLHTAVMRKPDETVVFSWITWPSKEVRDAGWEKIMSGSEMPSEMPFDGKRMIFGGFVNILDA